MTGLEAVKTSLEESSGMSAVKNKTQSYSALIIFTLNDKVQKEQIRYIPLTNEGWWGGGQDCQKPTKRTEKGALNWIGGAEAPLTCPCFQHSLNTFQLLLLLGSWRQSKRLSHSQ